MTIINEIEFIIDHIDPLGQGVFKKDDKIYFIPKTLPGESGTAQILKRKKGVHFCKKVSIDSISEKRVKPSCSHFQDCNGCHFLHTDYDTELYYKLQSFKRMLAPLLHESQIEVVKADNRLNYRNRVQLHYHKKAKVLGLIDGRSNQIISVPECIICKPNIQKKIAELYKDQNWLNLAPDETKGHIEIYDSPQGLKTTWNQRYASGGFTQVNESMNEKMKLLVFNELKEVSPKSTLDLFGGDGNLSNSLNKKTIIDRYDKKMPSHFISLDLHDEDALNRFTQKSQEDYDTFIIDPPRAGFSHIKDWTTALSPSNLFYISCHPQTMVRDLIRIQELNQYTIKKIVMLDLFPGTFHFEAFIVLKKDLNCFTNDSLT